jgi:DNA replication protein DnaC
VTATAADATTPAPAIARGRNGSTATDSTTKDRHGSRVGSGLGSGPPAAPPLDGDLLAALSRMRLPYLRAAAPEVLATARAQRWDPAEVVKVLLHEEIRGRDEATRRMRRKTAGLPAGKTFASWREADSSIPPGTQTGLATLEWIGRAENLAVAGPSGTGKSHFVEAIAHQVIDTGMRVAWFTLESLTATVGRAAVDGTVAKTIARIVRADLIVVDDIGMLPAGQAAGEAFYRLVDAAYERRSVAVTSNIHPSGFDTIMPKTLATATVDRLLHHAHVVITEGTSLRLAEATAGAGVRPL